MAPFEASAGPKRILAIDGGCVRATLAIGIVTRLEATRRAKLGRPGLVLSDYFDLIGGTSTGAIIAAGLALGRDRAHPAEIYRRLGPRVFRRGIPWIPAHLGGPLGGGCRPAAAVIGTPPPLDLHAPIWPPPGRADDQGWMPNRLRGQSYTQQVEDGISARRRLAHREFGPTVTSGQRFRCQILRASAKGSAIRPGGGQNGDQ